MIKQFKFWAYLTVCAALFSTSAQAQQANLSAEEVARASAECEVAISVDCLITLALDIAVNNVEKPPLALSDIVSTQVDINDLAGAKVSATYGWVHYPALLKIGRWDEATAQATENFSSVRVEFGTPEGSYLRRLVRAQMNLGELDLALRTVQSSPVGNEAWFTVMELLIEQNEYARAIELVNSAPFERARNDSYLDIVIAQSEAGQIIDAFDTLANFESEKHYCDALIAIANAQILIGTLDQARDNLNLAFEIASAGKIKSRYRTALLVEIAKYQLEAGDISGAEKSAILSLEKLGRYHMSRQHVAKELGDVGVMLFQVGLEDEGQRAFDKAAELIPEIANEFEETRALLELQLDRAKVEGPAAMAELLELTDSPLREIQAALPLMISKLVESEFLTEALIVASHLEGAEINPYPLDKAYSEIAAAYVELDELEKATIATGNIQTDYSRVSGGLTIAKRMSENGHSEKARIMLLDLLNWPEEYAGGDLLNQNSNGYSAGSIAPVLAEIGYVDDARKAFQIAYKNLLAIEDKQRRFPILLRLVQSLHEAFPNSPN